METLAFNGDSPFPAFTEEDSKQESPNDSAIESITEVLSVRGLPTSTRKALNAAVEALARGKNIETLARTLIDLQKCQIAERKFWCYSEPVFRSSPVIQSAMEVISLEIRNQINQF